MITEAFADAMQRILDQTGPVRTIIVALSGGMDSVALLHLLTRWRTGPNAPECIAAHMHHGIREHDADADTEFCRQYADRLGVELVVRTVDVPGEARRMRLGVEETGRVLRYRFFHDLVRDESEDSALVVTGHHADDQAETILLHLRRGAHRRGLAGMREFSVLPVPPDGRLQIGRPLLTMGREKVHAYACLHELLWREDTSNADPAYARNRIRHRVVPMLEALVPGFRDRLLAKAAVLAAEEEVLVSEGAALAKLLSRHEHGGRFFALPPEAFAVQERFMYALRHVVEEEMGSRLPYGAVLSSLADLARHGRLGEALTLPGCLIARKEQDGLFFYFPGEEEEAEEAEIILPDPPFDIDVSGFRVMAEWLPTSGVPPEIDRNDPEVEWLNPAGIRWPLHLRPPRPGERFRPLGAPGSKKVHDILVDGKFPRRKRQSVRMLADYAGGIWLWPFRIANRVALSGAATKALRMTIRETRE